MVRHQYDSNIKAHHSQIMRVVDKKKQRGGFFSRHAVQKNDIIIYNWLEMTLYHQSHE